ncbi:MAG: 30S ribosomal protein S20 [Candidatus Cloacimonetes bacterium]|nr:30S ribosomal protein S20 [Candidatus Cloacimonadota bacterium]MBL7148905.1 30S ribosomal protein S20 [Candidatus Cloacimonadota bacterium]
MPNHKSCEKRLRQEEKRSAGNHYVKMTINTLAKKMHSEISIEDKEKLLSEVYAQLDKAAKRNIIHKRTSSRRKSRLAAYFNKEKASQVKEEPKKEKK